MIESAMMFALGVFVSGLLALTFFGAYARRTRRVVERRLRARMAVGRAEIDAERDELRARHAVEVRRLEREIGHLRDQATASRLDGDVKEQELTGLRAEIDALTSDVIDYEERLDELLDQLHEVERESAERAGGIRALQYQIEREEEHRAQVQDALEEAGELARQRWIEVERLFAENSELRAATGRTGPRAPAKTILDAQSVPQTAAVSATTANSKPDQQRPQAYASLFAKNRAQPPADTVSDSEIPDSGTAPDKLPVSTAQAQSDDTARTVTPLAEPPVAPPAEPVADTDQHAATDDKIDGQTGDKIKSDSALPADDTADPARIRKIAGDVQRMAGETASDLFRIFRRKKPKSAEKAKAPATEITGTLAEPEVDHGDVTDLSAEREARRKMPQRASGAAAEAQLMSAVEEIRALQKEGKPGPHDKPAHAEPARDAQAGE